MTQRPIRQVVRIPVPAKPVSVMEVGERAVFMCQPDEAVLNDILAALLQWLPMSELDVTVLVDYDKCEAFIELATISYVAVQGGQEQAEQTEREGEAE